MVPIQIINKESRLEKKSTYVYFAIFTIILLIMIPFSFIYSEVNIGDHINNNSNEFFDNNGSAVLVNEKKEIFVAGISNSYNFTLKNKTNAKLSSDFDIFLMKLTPEGEPIFVNYYGGTGNEILFQMSIINGKLLLFGNTDSDDLNVNITHGNPSPLSNNILILELNQNGDVLNSILIGGSSSDIVNSVYFNNTNFILTGTTRSVDFPIINSYDSTFNGGIDGFILILNENYDLISSTYFGGENFDTINSVAIDNINNNIIITGQTNSNNFPKINENNTLDSIDGFLAIISSNLSNIIMSKVFGGDSYDNPQFVISDPEGQNLFLVGITDSKDFLYDELLSNPLKGGFDIFVTKFSLNELKFIDNRFFGGSFDENIESIAIDGSKLYISGISSYLNNETNDINFLRVVHNPDSRELLFLLEYDLNSNNFLDSILISAGSVPNIHSNYKLWKNGDLLFITGTILEDNLFIKNAFKKTKGLSSDGFLIIYNISSNEIIFSTYIGDYNLNTNTDLSLNILFSFIFFILTLGVYIVLCLSLLLFYLKEMYLNIGSIIVYIIGFIYLVINPLVIPFNSRLSLNLLNLDVLSIYILIFMIIYGLFLILIGYNSSKNILELQKYEVVIYIGLFLQFLTILIPSNIFFNFILDLNQFMWFPGMLGIIICLKNIKVKFYQEKNG